MDNIKDPAIALLTLNEVAAYLKVTPRTVHRMIRDERIVAYKVGNGWRIRTDDLLRCAFAQSSVKIEAEIKGDK